MRQRKAPSVTFTYEATGISRMVEEDREIQRDIRRVFISILKNGDCG